MAPSFALWRSHGPSPANAPATPVASTQSVGLAGCVGLQGGARPGQAVLQPVREKDVKLGALARSGVRFSATVNGKRVENHNGDKALRWWAADEGIFPGC